jgi:pyrroline-5-carboxylate reductase
MAARQTVYGVGTMLSSTSIPASTLRENVTSPGGTTQAGLEVLMDKLPSLIEQTLKAAHKRSIELK